MFVSSKEIGTIGTQREKNFKELNQIRVFKIKYKAYR